MGGDQLLLFLPNRLPYYSFIFYATLTLCISKELIFHAIFQFYKIIYSFTLNGISSINVLYTGAHVRRIMYYDFKHKQQYLDQGVHHFIQSKWRLVHSFLYILETQNQNFRSIRPKITLQRAKNKNQWPSAADRPYLAVLKLSRAEPLQPYFWSD